MTYFEERPITDWIERNQFWVIAILAKCKDLSLNNQTVSFMDAVNFVEWHSTRNKRIPKNCYGHLQREVMRRFPDIQFTQLY